METTNKTGVTAALALAAALTIGWLFLRPSEVESPAPTTDTQLQTKTSVPTETVDIKREQTQPANHADKGAPAAQDDVILVRLVRGDTGEVIPDHELWYTRTFEIDTFDREASIKSRGNSIHSDSAGIARIENAPQQLILYARKNHLVGSQWLHRRSYREAGKAFATLELYPENSISVTVIDARGIPAPGVSLRFSPLTDGTPTQRWNWNKATGEDGQVVWKNFGISLRRVQQDSRGTFTGLRIQALVPGYDPVSLDISPLPNHGQSFELQIQPTGSLNIRLLDPTGNLVPGKDWAQIRPLERNEEAGKWTRGEAHTVTLEKGVGAFPKVALGCYFELAIVNRFWPPLKTEVFGPTSENPSVTRDISLEDSRVIWRGRAVDGTGHGLDETRLRCDIKSSKETRTAYADTDSEGGFLAVFPESFADVELSKAAINLGGYAPIDLLSRSPFSKGVMEVGDVVFGHQVALLSGEVVSSPDAACQSYRLKIERRPPGTANWQAVETKLEKTGAKFTFLGNLSEGEHRLLVTSWRRCHILMEPIPFTPGQENLIVRLDTGHNLAADIFIAGATGKLAGAKFFLLLRLISGKRTEQLTADRSDGIRGYLADHKQENKHRYTWAGLRTGIYNLEVWASDEETLLRTISDLAIPRPDGKTLVIEIDLSAELREFRLHLRTPNGIAPEQGTTVLLHKGNKLFSGSWISGEKTNLLVIAPPGIFGLWILASGYQPVWMQSLNSDHDVILTPSDLDLSIRLREAGTLPDGVSLKVHIEGQAEIHPQWKGSGWEYTANSFSLRMSTRTLPNRYWPQTASKILDQKATTTLTLHRQGPQTLRIELVATTAARRASWPKAKVWIDGVTPARFDVDTTIEARTLQITIPPAALQAALQEAGIR